MKTETIFCAIDVDDKAYHGAVRIGNKEECMEFKTRPQVSALLKKLESLGIALNKVRVSYEATYIGFDIHRKLTDKGVHCDIIAPSSIPQTSGRKVKTDRVDARKLVEYYQKNILTFIYIQTKDDEATRSLVRSRLQLREQTQSQKLHLNSLCRIQGWNYRAEIMTPTAEYWTKQHRQWLDEKVKGLADGSDLKFNFQLILGTIQFLEAQIAVYADKIKEIAKRDRYRDAIKALEAFRGIDTLSAISLMVEIVDANRFPHPNNLSSYTGFSIEEHTSGGNEKRYSITKQGNKYIRTIVVEACQTVMMKPIESRSLKKRREGVDKEIVAVADRCKERLYKKSMRMFHKGKPKNKIKVACAREMLGFIWEALKKVS